MAQWYVVDQPAALRVAPAARHSLFVGLAAGLAVLLAVYAGLAVAFVRALPPASLDLSVPSTMAPVAVDAPLILETIGWGTGVDGVTLTEYTIGADGQVADQREVPVIYRTISEGRLPGESRGLLVRPDGGSPLAYDAQYELKVRGQGYEWSLGGRRTVPLVAAAAFSTSLSPRPDYSDNPTLPAGEPLAIGWNVPLASLEYQVSPPAQARLWFNEEHNVAYIALENPEQGTQYQVDLTGATSSEGAPMRGLAAAKFNTAPALRVVAMSPDNGARDVAAGQDPILTFSAAVANPDIAADHIVVDPPVDGQFRWLAPDRVQFVTDKGFPYSTDVTLTVQAGPDGLRSTAGGYVEEPAAFAYRTRVHKHIDVNLSRQQVTLLEDNVVVYRTAASTGVRGAETPTGNFTIQYKMTKTRMRGTNPDGHTYDIPDVPWVMALFGDYTLHGAPWRQAWGVPLSNGCVSMPTPNAKYVYDWTPVGTSVSIHY
jgi:lipoprotein-anchoring transpeptidase ErfK/SrfK